MNRLEEIARIVMRIRDLRERIDGEKDKGSVWLEILEVGALKLRLEKMKHRLIKTKEA